MTHYQEKLFWKEVDLIQQRHLIFFPKEQKKYLRIKETDDGTILEIQKENQLSSIIILEIEFAFRLIYKP